MVVTVCLLQVGGHRDYGAAALQMSYPKRQGYSKLVSGLPGWIFENRSERVEKIYAP